VTFTQFPMSEVAQQNVFKYSNNWRYPESLVGYGNKIFFVARSPSTGYRLVYASNAGYYGFPDLALISVTGSCTSAHVIAGDDGNVWLYGHFATAPTRRAMKINPQTFATVQYTTALTTAMWLAPPLKTKDGTIFLSGTDKNGTLWAKPGVQNAPALTTPAWPSYGAGSGEGYFPDKGFAMTENGSAYGLHGYPAAVVGISGTGYSGWMKTLSPDTHTWYADWIWHKDNMIHVLINYYPYQRIVSFDGDNPRQVTYTDISTNGAFLASSADPLSGRNMRRGSDGAWYQTVYQFGPEFGTAYRNNTVVRMDGNTVEGWFKPRFVDNNYYNPDAIIGAYGEYIFAALYIEPSNYRMIAYKIGDSTHVNCGCTPMDTLNPVVVGTEH